MSSKEWPSRRRPSPALAIALVALVLASVGSAAAVGTHTSAGPVAHVNKHEPRHKKKAPACLSSAGSLCAAIRQAVDHETAAYLAAHQSTVHGATGATGPTGGAGSAGAANGFTDQHPGPSEPLTLSGIATVVSSFNLPAGKYVVQADVHLARLSSESPVTRKLVGAMTIDEAFAEIGNTPGHVSTADLALGGPLTLAGPGSLRVQCSAEVGGVVSAYATMTAVEVANLTSTTT